MYFFPADWGYSWVSGKSPLLCSRLCGQDVLLNNATNICCGSITCLAQQSGVWIGTTLDLQPGGCDNRWWMIIQWNDYTHKTWLWSVQGRQNSGNLSRPTWQRKLAWRSNWSWDPVTKEEGLLQMAVHDGVKERGPGKKKEACVAGVQEWGGWERGKTWGWKCKRESSANTIGCHDLTQLGQDSTLFPFTCRRHKTAVPWFLPQGISTFIGVMQIDHW